MNKLEYLNQLETILKKQRMNKADIDDIIRDYAEFFEEGRRQGESDAEICAKLGSPELIAEQILEENGHKVAIAPVQPKTEFKMPKFQMPKFERKEKEEKPKKKKAPSQNLGCLGSSLLMIIKLLVLVFVGGMLAVAFGCAGVALGSVFVGLICLFFAVIIGFFAASLAAHFLTLPVTIFAIVLCIALLALIICVGALLLMLMGWCGKLFLSILRGIMDWPKVTIPEPVPVEETMSNEEEGELYE